MARFGVKDMTLRIERAVEKTKKYGLRLKEPKRARHKRTITTDDDLIALLLAEWEKHLRIKAGVPDGAAVDLSLVKLPDDALMFPSSPARGESFHSRSCETSTASPRASRRRPAHSAFPASDCTICREYTRHCCSIGASRCMSSPLGAGMIQPCCCVSMPSARARRIRALPRPSRLFPKA